MVGFQDYSEFDVATLSAGKEVSWQLGASQPTCSYMTVTILYYRHVYMLVTPYMCVFV